MTRPNGERLLVVRPVDRPEDRYFNLGSVCLSVAGDFYGSFTVHESQEVVIRQEGTSIVVAIRYKAPSCTVEFGKTG